MTENIEEEHAAVESESSPARLSLIGGAVGTVVGLRRSKTAAVFGGLLGGAIGYMAGTASQGQAGSSDGADEPVVVTVDDSDSEDDADATETMTEESESDGSEEQGDED